MLNGVEHRLDDVATVDDVVRALVEQPDRGVAVALDGEVIVRTAWRKTMLTEGAQLEVLRAAQGG